jgi:lipopolysaccharide/colanic/teichoic acid biosynthesis glycosyltransferase
MNKPLKIMQVTMRHKIMFLLAILDIASLAVAFYLAYYLRFHNNFLLYHLVLDPTSYVVLFIFSLPVFIIIFYCCHLYDNDELFYGTSEYVQVIKGVCFGVVGVISVSFLIHGPPPSRGWLLLFWLSSTVLMGIGRFAARRILRPRLRDTKHLERVLIVGANEEATAITRRLMETSHLEVVGFLDDFSPVGEQVINGLKVQGSPKDFAEISQKERVSKLILIPGAVSWETTREILSAAYKMNGLTLLVAPGFGDLFSVNLKVSYVDYVPFLKFRPGYNSGFNRVLKGIIDWSLASIFFLSSLPIILVWGAWIWYRRGRPIFETQEILGRHGRPFLLYKFSLLGVQNRSFYSSGAKIECHATTSLSILERIVLRTGLDRLPNFINVLKGQMSLVGPHPLKSNNKSSYRAWLPNLLSVKPGMTGPWAIEDIDSLQQEVSTTLSYIHNWTPWKDMQILILTLFYLLQKGLKVPSTSLQIYSSDKGRHEFFLPETRRNSVQSQ